VSRKLYMRLPQLSQLLDRTLARAPKEQFGAPAAHIWQRLVVGFITNRSHCICFPCPSLFCAALGILTGNGVNNLCCHVGQERAGFSLEQKEEIMQLRLSLFNQMDAILQERQTIIAKLQVCLCSAH
jgi:hypothetical protein